MIEKRLPARRKGLHIAGSHRGAATPAASHAREPSGRFRRFLCVPLQSVGLLRRSYRSTRTRGIHACQSGPTIFDMPHASGIRIRVWGYPLRRSEARASSVEACRWYCALAKRAGCWPSNIAILLPANFSECRLDRRRSALEGGNICGQFSPVRREYRRMK